MRRREIARSFVDWSLGAQEPLWDRLHEITIPVLWVAGENDAKFRALAERAVALIPQRQARRRARGRSPRAVGGGGMAGGGGFAAFPAWRGFLNIR